MSEVSGVKLDNGKEDCDLVLGSFSRSLLEVSKVGTFGAIKYCEDGWLDVERGYRRYTSAMLRHYFKGSEIETHDLESGLLHDAHCAWNALARLELNLRGIVELTNNKIPMYESLGELKQ